MGYNATYFNIWTQRWLDEGWLPPGGRVVELGSQELDGKPLPVRANLRRFLLGLGLPAGDVRNFVGSLKLPCPASAVYEFAGFEYLCLDVNEAGGSMFLDLNTGRVPRSLHHKFDVVNDEGTIEHLGNPINGFAVAHDLAKVGGVIRHSLPLEGHMLHGLYNFTPKLFLALALANEYELLYFYPQINAVVPSGGTIEEIFLRMRKNWPSAVLETECQQELAPGVQQAEFVEVDAWAHIAFRKVHDRPFALPVDHLLMDADHSLRTLLRARYERFVERGTRPGLPTPAKVSRKRNR